MELVLKGGRVLDPGSGTDDWFDVGIESGRVKEIAPSLAGREELDVSGLCVAPGFIDIHIHEDLDTGRGLELHTQKQMALMGVTTVVGGNCGLGADDIPAYLDSAQSAGCYTHLAMLVGYNALRRKLGYRDPYEHTPADAWPLLRALVRQGLEAGAFGMSYGLEYEPGITTEEMIEQSSVLLEYPGTLVAAHYRGDADMACDSIEELAQVSRSHGLRVQFSHIGSAAAMGQMDEALSLLERLLQDGVDIRADCYPYDAFATYAGSTVYEERNIRRMGLSYDRLLATTGRYRGQRLTEDALLEIRQKEPEVRIVAFAMNEEEVIRALSHPLVMVASDGAVRDGGGHPRVSGTFPRVLGRFVRQGRLDFYDSLRKMTLMPAERLGLVRKGRLIPGSDADICVFDPESLEDRSTYTEPLLPAAGIEHVLVGGQFVVRDGQFTGIRAGKVLRRV